MRYKGNNCLITISANTIIIQLTPPKLIVIYVFVCVCVFIQSSISTSRFPYKELYHIWLTLPCDLFTVSVSIILVQLCTYSQHNKTTMYSFFVLFVLSSMYNIIYNYFFYFQIQFLENSFSSCFIIIFLVYHIIIICSQVVNIYQHEVISDAI